MLAPTPRVPSRVSPAPLQVVTTLCDYGANLNCRARDGSTALEVAAAMGHVAVLEHLLARGAHFGSAMHFEPAAARERESQAVQVVGGWSVQGWVVGGDFHRTEQ